MGLTVPALKEILTQHGMSSSGRKRELIARIADSEAITGEALKALVQKSSKATLSRQPQTAEELGAWLIDQKQSWREKRNATTQPAMGPSAAHDVQAWLKMRKREWRSCRNGSITKYFPPVLNGSDGLCEPCSSNQSESHRLSESTCNDSTSCTLAEECAADQSEWVEWFDRLQQCSAGSALEKLGVEKAADMEELDSADHVALSGYLKKVQRKRYLRCCEARLQHEESSGKPHGCNYSGVDSPSLLERKGSDGPDETVWHWDVGWWIMVHVHMQCTIHMQHASYHVQAAATCTVGTLSVDQHHDALDLTDIYSFSN